MKTTLLLAAGLLLCTSGFSQNVGIGTTNPEFKLDVRNGSINTDSVYRIGTNTVLAVPGEFNLFAGKYAGRINTGFYNTFSGDRAGYFNTTGSANSFFGQNAGYFNTTGSSNSFFGQSAGYFNTTGSSNSFFGGSAGFTNTIGTNNTAVGFAANVGTAALNNATAIGYNTIVDANDKVRLGNAFVSSIGGEVGWTSFSDGRFKHQVQEDVQGLAFIKKLRTVSFLVDLNALNNYYLTEKSEIDKSSSLQQDAITQSQEYRQSGFIAQEVEQAAKELGFSFSGVDKPQNEKTLYGLRYGDFVVPLVKAVQEQQVIIEEQNKKIEMLMNEIALIKEKLK